MMELLTSAGHSPAYHPGFFGKKKKPLVEVIENFKYEIVEGSGMEGKSLRVRGLVQRADTLNENNRKYPRRIFEKTFRPESPVMQKIHERGFYGELDHPDDGQTKLSRTSHIVVEASMNEAGEVWAVFEILPTEAGRKAEALFRAQCKIGTSSRGSGEVLSEGGCDVVQDDFILEAFDFVHNPSTHGAFMSVEEQVNQKFKESYMATNSLDAYRFLERSAQDLLRIDARTITPEIRPFVESSMTDLIYKLSTLGEEAADVKPLSTGLLAELTTAKQNLFKSSLTEVGEGASNNMPPELLKKLGVPGFKDNPKVPTVVPPVKGVGKPLENKTEEEAKIMAENAVKEAEANKRLERMLGELGEAVKESGDTQGRKEKITKETVRQIEANIARSTNGFLKKLKEEGEFTTDTNSPADKTPLEAEGDEDEDEDEDEEKKPFKGAAKPFESRRTRPLFSEDEQAFEVPDPPDDLADDAAAGPGENDDEDLPPLEAKLMKTVRTLVRENKKLRYQKKVTEALAGHSLALLTKAVRHYKTEARKPHSVTEISVRGQKISIKLIPAVVESLIRRYKTIKRSVAVRESRDVRGEREHGALPGVRPADPSAFRSLNEDLVRNGTNGPRRDSPGDSIMEHQIALSDAVFNRMKPKPHLKPAAAAK